VLAWLSVWSEVQTCTWPSWCHCHSLSLAPVKSRSVLPFWYRLTRVVPDKGPLNARVCVWISSTTCSAVAPEISTDSASRGPSATAEFLVSRSFARDYYTESFLKQSDVDTSSLFGRASLSSLHVDVRAVPAADKCCRCRFPLDAASPSSPAYDTIRLNIDLSSKSNPIVSSSKKLRRVDAKTASSSSSTKM